MLPPILPTLLLSMLERERVLGKQTRLHQEVYKVDTRSTSKGARDGISKQRPHPSPDLTVLMRTGSCSRASQVQNQSRLDVTRAPGPRVFHPIAHLFLPTRLLSKHGAARRAYRSGLQERLLLLS